MLAFPCNARDAQPAQPDVGLTTMTEVVLLVYLVRRKLFRSHPFFIGYILAAILQSIALALAYKHGDTKTTRPGSRAGLARLWL